jgi:YD repeat-containing protein
MKTTFRDAAGLSALLACLLVSASAARTFTYDNLNRVTHVRYDDGSNQSYAYDDAGNITSVQSVGPDTSRPIIAAPDTVQAFCLPGDTVAKVYFSLRAVDVIDGAVPVASNPESGGTFHLGATTVTCTAINSRGVASADSFIIIVKISTVGPMAGAIAVSVMTKGVRIAVQTGAVGSAHEKQALHRMQLAKMAIPPLWADAQAVSAKPANTNQRILIESSQNNDKPDTVRNLPATHFTAPVIGVAAAPVPSVLAAAHHTETKSLSENDDGSSFEGILTAPATGLFKIWLRGAPGATVWLSDSDKPTDNHIVLETTAGALQTFLAIQMRKGEKRYIRGVASNDPAGFCVDFVGSGILPERLPGKYIMPVLK